MNSKRLLALVLALGMLLIGNARADITNGLVLYLPMNETTGLTANDMSGLGNNGTLIGFAGDDTQWTTAGRLGGAVKENFNGIKTQYVSVPDSSNLNFGTQNAFTLSAWVQATTAQVAGGSLICKGTGGGNEQYNIDINGNKFRFFIRNSGGAATPVTSTLGLTTTFQQVTAVYDGSATTLKIYVNGVLNVASTNANNSSLRTTVHEVSIGNRQSAAAGYNLPLTNAVVDEVRIYNRALSASDVYELYALNGKAPIITTQPRNVSAYIGDTPIFTVAIDTVNSILPVSYQWQINGTNVLGATGPSLILTNAQLESAGIYAVTVSNVVGVTTSSNAVLALAPLPAANTANGLVGYWKLDETSGSGTAADSTANANTGTLLGFGDYSTVWVTGLISNALNFNATATTGDYLSIPDSAPLNFTNTLAFTLAAWVKGPAVQTNGGAVIAKGTGGGGEQYSVDINGGKYRFYLRNAGGTVFTINSPVAPNGTWQHLVMEMDATSGIMNMYVNGQLVGVSVAPTTFLSNSHEVSVGNRQSGAATSYNLPWTGAIDDVHIYNRALTSADVQALYLEGGVFPPAIVTNPIGGSVYVGDRFQLTGLASGTTPLLYQWLLGGVKIPGATNSSLLYTNMQLTNAGMYSFVASNAYGSATSSIVQVQVSTFNLTNNLAGWWKFDDGTNSSTALDSSTNANTAFLNNFVDFDSEWITGRIDGGVNFNGSPANQYVYIPDTANLNFDTGKTFSISAWVRGGTAQANGAGIIAKGFGGLNEEFAIDAHVDQLATVGYRFYIRNAASASTALTTPVAPNNLWQHIVATYDGNNGIMNFFVNGQLVATTASAPTTLLADNGHEVSIGGREGGSATGYNLPWVGAVDDVRIYNRALNQTDVQELYQSAPPLAPVFYTQPLGNTRFDGDTVNFTALVDGTSPLTFQWRKDGNPISGANGTSLTFTNVQVSDSGTYTLLATNSAGMTVSSNAVLNVLPFQLTNAVVILPFDESSGLVASDATGHGNDGSLLGFLGDGSESIPGRIGRGLAFNSDGAGQTVVTVPDTAALNFTNSLAFSLAAWVKGVPAQPSGAAIICKGAGAGGEQYTLDIFNGTYRFFVRNTPTSAPGISSTIGLNDRWQHVVATFDAAAGLMKLYVNAHLEASIPAPTSLLPNTHELSIGNRQNGATTPYNLPFKGAIDDVRIYARALKQSDVDSLYAQAGSLAPVLYTQPQDVTAYFGDTVVFSALADGSDPLSYQWLKNGAAISGATGSTLTLNNVQLSAAGNYSLMVTNSGGMIVSSNALLAVVPLPPPDLTNNLMAYWKFDETNGLSAADASGNGVSASLYNFPGDDSQWVQGRIGGAIHLNAGGAVSQFAGTDAGFALANGDQFSFSFWALRDSTTTGINPRFISPLSGTHWVLWNPGHGVGLFTPAASTEPSPATWHHFVVVYDRLAGSYSLYVDGARQVASATGYSKPDPTGSLWIIGHSESATSDGDSFNGLLDEMRVYNRLLTLNDVQALYYMGAQPKLTITASGANVTLSWAKGADGYHLQKADSLTGAWSDVSGTAATSADGATQSLTVSADAAARFYRLQNP